MGLEVYLLPPGRVPGIGPERAMRVRDGIAHYADPYGSHRYVLFAEGEPAAALQVMSFDGRSAVVANAYTRPDERRRGYAAKLLAMARKDFRGGVRHAEDAMLSAEGRAFAQATRDRKATRPSRKPPRRAPRARAGRDVASLAVGAVVGGTFAAAGAALTHRDAKGRLFVLPPNHLPAMVVPHGGSSCANCKYVYYPASRGTSLGQPHCKDPGFVIWNRGTRLPVDDARDYCSDWYVPAPGAIAAAAPPRLRRGSR